MLHQAKRHRPVQCLVGGSTTQLIAEDISEQLARVAAAFKSFARSGANLLAHDATPLSSRRCGVCRSSGASPTRTCSRTSSSRRDPLKPPRRFLPRPRNGSLSNPWKLSLRQRPDNVPLRPSGAGKQQAMNLTSSEGRRARRHRGRDPYSLVYTKIAKTYLEIFYDFNPHRVRVQGERGSRA